MAQQMPVGDLLQCTICLDVPASPVHNCSNGHIICGICADQVTECGLCLGDLQLSVLAERLSRQLDLKSKCPNYDDGCRNLIASTKMKDHIPKCYFRTVVCNERTKKVCNNVAIPFKDYPQHMEEHHSCKHGCGTVTRECRAIVNNKLNESNWPLKMATKDGLFFLLHNHKRKDAAYFWMTILADKGTALKYMYELTLERKVNGRNMKCSWTLPVLPYHDYPKWKYPSSHFITIPAPFLIEFCDKKETEDKISHTFKMSHRIL